MPTHYRLFARLVVVGAIVGLAPLANAQIGTGLPIAPIALGECLLPSNGCSGLGAAIVAPDGVTTFWTSLAAEHAAPSALVEILPSICCSQGACGGDGAPSIDVGDRIAVFGQTSPKVLRIVAACVDRGLREFIVPIVPCGGPDRGATVVGFARAFLVGVNLTGGDRGLTLRIVCESGS